MDKNSNSKKINSKLECIGAGINTYTVNLF